MPPLLPAAPPLRNAVLTSQTIDAVNKGCRQGMRRSAGAARCSARQRRAPAGVGTVNAANALLFCGVLQSEFDLRLLAPLHLCSSQTGANITGCQQCRAGLAGCRDPLAVLSRLCSKFGGSASLPQCATLAAMCSEAGATFTSLCNRSSAGAASGGVDAPPGQAALPAELKMYLHASMSGALRPGQPAAALPA